MSFFLFGDSSYSILAWFACFLFKYSLSDSSQFSLTPFLLSLTQICIHSFNYYIFISFCSLCSFRTSITFCYLFSFISVIGFILLTSFPTSISSHIISSFVSPSLFWVLKFLVCDFLNRRDGFIRYISNCDKVTCTAFNLHVELLSTECSLFVSFAVISHFFFFFFVNHYSSPISAAFVGLFLFFYSAVQNSHICPESKLHYVSFCVSSILA